jgi:plasmid stabilization system protein ParE
VAQVVYSRRAFAGLERLADFAHDKSPQVALEGIEVILDGVEILQRHPLIGRLCETPVRELVISYGKTGYVALYSYEVAEDVALSLALRHQREAGHGDFPSSFRQID